MNDTPVFKRIELFLKAEGFQIVAVDQSRPWGGFFALAETDSIKFANLFFKDDVQYLKTFSKLSPKILLVAPQLRLSWQYHHRRAEIWKCLEEPVAIAISETDIEEKTVTLNPGEAIKLKQGERHRLIGLNDWGVVAEIWQHTDALNPSDEDDIIRLQDDFKRN